MHANINSDAYDAQELLDLHNFNSILSTIPKANQLTQLSFRFTVYGRRHFSRCLEQDWVGMCDEVVRVSAGKPLELYLERTYSMLRGRPAEEVFNRIEENVASLSDYPNIRLRYI